MYVHMKWSLGGGFHPLFIFFSRSKKRMRKKADDSQVFMVYSSRCDIVDTSLAIPDGFIDRKRERMCEMYRIQFGGLRSYI